MRNRALKNHLLAALPTGDFARLKPHLKSVLLPLGHVLYESGEQMDRQGLENYGFECYQVVKDEYDRLLGDYQALVKC